MRDKQIIYESTNICKKHSGFGIISFTIGLSIIIFDFWLIMIVGTYGRSIARALNEDAVFTFIGTLALSTYFINLIAVLFGIAGLLKKNRKKIFSILGIIINALVIAVMILSI